MKPDEMDTWEQKHLVSKVLAGFDIPFSRDDAVAAVKKAYPAISKGTILDTLYEYRENGYVQFTEVSDGDWMYTVVIQSDGFDGSNYAPPNTEIYN